jgi:hypothetical protein
MRQTPIALLLFFRQPTLPGLLDRQLTIGVPMVQSHIATIGQAADLLRNQVMAALEDGKIMLAPIGKDGGDHGMGLLVHDQLRFLSMVLLFTAVILPLLFFGRSIGCSVPSIKITSIQVSLPCKALRPGRRN